MDWHKRWFYINLTARDESWSQPYRHDPGDPNSLSEDWVFSFLEDREGRLWIGTVGGGLNQFDPEKEMLYPLSKRS